MPRFRLALLRANDLVVDPAYNEKEGLDFDLLEELKNTFHTPIKSKKKIVASSDDSAPTKSEANQTSNSKTSSPITTRHNSDDWSLEDYSDDEKGLVSQIPPDWIGKTDFTTGLDADAVFEKAAASVHPVAMSHSNSLNNLVETYETLLSRALPCKCCITSTI